ncbi:MAG: glutamate synthase-related protein [Thermodesulfobacteriota bacterium]
MPKKYHIPIVEAPPRFIPVGKSTILDWEGGCLRCFKCVKRVCIYDAYNKRSFDRNRLADTIDSVCKNCLRCVQMCPGQVISKKLNPEYAALGDNYWTPEIITKQWEQAGTGKIPVSGAGYRGPFSGPGFDDMWTDMSEIVRPTRDGIHGREYINTSVALGRKPARLTFDASGAPDLGCPANIELPIPILFGELPFAPASPTVTENLALAASRLGTLCEIPAKSWTDALDKYAANLVPVVGVSDLGAAGRLIAATRMTALACGKDLKAAEMAVAEFKAQHPDKVLMVKIPLNEKAQAAALALSLAGADVLSLCADRNGNGLGKKSATFVKDLVREVHLALVARGDRDSVTILSSGGVAMAEHVAKAVICGADAVVVDVALLLAMECTLCLRCEKGLDCPVDIGGVSPEWGAKRIMNLMGAWRNQILEVLGAMGLREVKRLRGEVGRAMFFNNLEAETFGRLFGKKKSA